MFVQMPLELDWATGKGIQLACRYHAPGPRELGVDSSSSLPSASPRLPPSALHRQRRAHANALSSGLAQVQRSLGGPGAVA